MRKIKLNRKLRDIELERKLGKDSIAKKVSAMEVKIASLEAKAEAKPK